MKSPLKTQPTRRDGTIISLRIWTHLWMDDARRGELLALLRDYRGTIEEVCFFTSITHSVLPYAEIARRAGLLAGIIPEFKELGIRVGINHLATLGHLDENLENSLNEPWQKMTDLNGTAAKGSYCPLDSRLQAFTRDCYQALAKAGPDFIWIDDDVRMGCHSPAIVTCFCDLCLARFAEETGELDGLHPKVVVILIGVNNLVAKDTPEETAAGVTAIVQETESRLPGAKILLMGIFPCFVRGSVQETNEIIAKLEDLKQVYFLDIGDQLGGPGILRDGIHPSEAGYRIWAEAMQPYLDDLLKNDGNGELWKKRVDGKPAN